MVFQEILKCKFLNYGSFDEKTLRAKKKGNGGLTQIYPLELSMSIFTPDLTEDGSLAQSLKVTQKMQYFHDFIASHVNFSFLVSL